MPHTIQLIDGVIHTHLTGTIRRRDLAELITRLEELEQSCDPSPNRICILGHDTIIDLDFLGMESIAARRRATTLKNPVWSALVARQPHQFGFLRMFQTLNTHPQIEIQVFSDEETALAWVTGAR